MTTENDNNINDKLIYRGVVRELVTDARRFKITNLKEYDTPYITVKRTVNYDKVSNVLKVSLGREASIEWNPINIFKNGKCLKYKYTLNIDATRVKRVSQNYCIENENEVRSIQHTIEIDEVQYNVIKDEILIIYKLDKTDKLQYRNKKLLDMIRLKGEYK